MKKRVLLFIKEYMKKEGVIPTITEICKGMGFTSTSSASYYISKLVEEGEIEFLEGSKRYRVRGMRYVEGSKD